MGQDKLVVLTDHVAVSLTTVWEAIKVVRKEGFEKLDPLIITQASSDCNFLFVFMYQYVSSL